MNCPTCGGKVQVVSGEEGTHFYTPVRGDAGKELIRRLKLAEAVADEQVEKLPGILIRLEEAEAELSQVQGQAAAMRKALELVQVSLPWHRKLEIIKKALSGDAGKALLARLERMEKALREIKGAPDWVHYELHLRKRAKDALRED